jgi:glycosyltransferase involved in cell wall biosynthesis
VTVSVVIPTSGRPELLAKALASLASDPSLPPAAEVVVVENGRPDGAERAAREAAAGMPVPVRYALEERPGLHSARHRGAALARHDVVAYLDDDVAVGRGWAAAIRSPFEDPRVACVGGPVGLELLGESPSWLDQFDPWYLSALDLGPVQRDVHWPEGVHGCNMAVRRQALLAVGGFNPDAFGDASMIWLRGDGEGGLQRKLLQGGHRILYEPTARVTHLIPASRLTPEAFARRARLEGITASFSSLRDRGFSGRYRAALLLRVTRALGLASRARAVAVIRRHRAVRARADAAFWRGFAAHHLRALLSRALRDHISRATFLIP